MRFRAAAGFAAPIAQLGALLGALLAALPGAPAAASPGVASGASGGAMGGARAHATQPQGPEAAGDVLAYAVRRLDELHLEFAGPVRLGLPHPPQRMRSLGIHWQVLGRHLWLRLERQLEDPVRLALDEGGRLRVLELRHDPLQRPPKLHRLSLVPSVGGRRNPDADYLRLTRWALGWEAGEHAEAASWVAQVPLGSLQEAPPRLLGCVGRQGGCPKLRAELLRVWEYAATAGRPRLQAWVWRLATSGIRAWDWAWLRGDWAGGCLADWRWESESAALDLELGGKSTLLVLLREVPT